MRQLINNEIPQLNFHLMFLKFQQSIDSGKRIYHEVNKKGNNNVASQDIGWKLENDMLHIVQIRESKNKDTLLYIYRLPS